jgi:AraC-like DNA-binding protein
MPAMPPEDYFCYIPESRLCKTLGCTMQSSGFTQVRRHSPYPVAIHPKDHHFNFSRGRILQAYQIVFISEGRGRAELGRERREQEIRGGMVFMLFPNVWHRYAPDPMTGWTEHWIECKGSAFDMAQGSGLIDINRPIFRNPNVEAIASTFAEIHDLARQDVLGHQPVLSMLGLKLLALLTAPNEAGSDGSARLVDAARMLLMERCAENQPMEAVAEELNVSYSYLRRSFRAATGSSMKEFQLSVRIQRAKDMLDNSDLSVKEIAGKLGFSSAFHFSNQFRKIAGCPPSDWRARPTRWNGEALSRSE